MNINTNTNKNKIKKKYSLQCPYVRPSNDQPTDQATNQQQPFNQKHLPNRPPACLRSVCFKHTYKSLNAVNKIISHTFTFKSGRGIDKVKTKIMTKCNKRELREA